MKKNHSYAIRDLIESSRESFRSGHTSANAAETQAGGVHHSFDLLVTLWQHFMTLLLSLFLLSSISQLAQYHQWTLDTELCASYRNHLPKYAVSDVELSPDIASLIQQPSGFISLNSSSTSCSPPESPSRVAVSE